MISSGVLCLLSALWLGSGASVFQPTDFCVTDPTTLSLGCQQLWQHDLSVDFYVACTFS